MPSSTLSWRANASAAPPSARASRPALSPRRPHGARRRPHATPRNRRRLRRGRTATGGPAVRPRGAEGPTTSTSSGSPPPPGPQRAGLSRRAAEARDLASSNERFRQSHAGSGGCGDRLNSSATDRRAIDGSTRRPVKLIVVSGSTPGSGKSTGAARARGPGLPLHRQPARTPAPDLVDSADERAADVPFAVRHRRAQPAGGFDRFPEIYETLRRERPQVALRDRLPRRRPGDPRAALQRNAPAPSAHGRRRAPAGGPGGRGGTARRHPRARRSGHRHHAHDRPRAARRDPAARRPAHVGAGLSLMFRSFGFKNGVPVDANMVFDVSCLPNPHWLPELREDSGHARTRSALARRARSTWTRSSTQRLHRALAA